MPDCVGDPDKDAIWYKNLIRSLRNDSTQFAPITTFKNQWIYYDEVRKILVSYPEPSQILFHEQTQTYNETFQIIVTACDVVDLCLNQTFNLTVYNRIPQMIQQSPQLQLSQKYQVLQCEKPFTYKILSNTFIDLDEDDLRYKLTTDQEES